MNVNVSMRELFDRALITEAFIVQFGRFDSVTAIGPCSTSDLPATATTKTTVAPVASGTPTVPRASTQTLLERRGINATAYAIAYPQVQNPTGMLEFANALAENNVSCALVEGKWPEAVLAIIYQIATEQARGSSLRTTSETVDGYAYSATAQEDAVSAWIDRLIAVVPCASAAYVGVPSDPCNGV